MNPSDHVTPNNCGSKCIGRLLLLFCCWSLPGPLFGAPLGGVWIQELLSSIVNYLLNTAGKSNYNKYTECKLSVGIISNILLLLNNDAVVFGDNRISSYHTFAKRSWPKILCAEINKNGRNLLFIT
jgi:hypothetical protein